jgi:hypothetical protein
MKDEALSIIRDESDPAVKLNLLREYIQFKVLRSLHESEAFVNLAFVGGTALRFLFNLPRFSEDLDFSVEEKENYCPEKWMRKVKRDLELSGFNTVLKWNGGGTVHKAWIRIPELLKEAGLAAIENQNLSIKLEIDTRPPPGARIEKTLVTRQRIISLQHYDLPSLMAGKIHALITRKYGKGRDWYDLLWYRGRRPPIEPNQVLLQNAFDQTQGKGAFKATDWKMGILRRLDGLDCHTLKEDILPFLEHPEDAKLFSEENFRSLLS